MQEKLFTGTYTAIITPFKKDGRVDYPSFNYLIERQIQAGIDGIVVCGTTGESPTLSHKEHSELIKKCVKEVDHRTKVIAGTGSNSTKEAIDLSIKAQRDGADAVLLVNPYYNKPTQQGLYLHFREISNSLQIPIILYNIKSRTGVNLEPSTLERLVNDCKNILGIKEASGDLNQINQVIKNSPEYFNVLSGDDNLTSEVIRLGGDGVVSVISNLLPEKTIELVNASLKKDEEKIEKINEELREIIQACFIETNPIPIKYMLSRKGLCQEVYRLPLCKLSDESKKKIDWILSKIER